MKVHAVPKTATKNPVGSSTQLQLHIKHQADVPLEYRSRAIDFSERKLRKILTGLFSAEKRVQVADLLDRYLAGTAAVGWSRGTPIFREVTKDSK